jgi:hypothetical protein
MPRFVRSLRLRFSLVFVALLAEIALTGTDLHGC